MSWNPPNPTKPKTWFGVSPKSSRKSPYTKSKTYLVRCLDTQLSPTKKCFVPNVDVLDFVGEISGGIICNYMKSSHVPGQSPWLPWLQRSIAIALWSPVQLSWQGGKLEQNFCRGISPRRGCDGTAEVSRIVMEPKKRINLCFSTGACLVLYNPTWKEQSMERCCQPHS